MGAYKLFELFGIHLITIDHKFQGATITKFHVTHEFIYIYITRTTSATSATSTVSPTLNNIYNIYNIYIGK